MTNHILLHNFFSLFFIGYSHLFCAIPINKHCKKNKLNLIIIVFLKICYLFSSCKTNCSFHIIDSFANTLEHLEEKKHSKIYVTERQVRKHIACFLKKKLPVLTDSKNSPADNFVT